MADPTANRDPRAHAGAAATSHPDPLPTPGADGNAHSLPATEADGNVRAAIPNSYPSTGDADSDASGPYH